MLAEGSHMRDKKDPKMKSIQRTKVKGTKMIQNMMKTTKVEK